MLKLSAGGLGVWVRDSQGFFQPDDMGGSLHFLPWRQLRLWAVVPSVRDRDDLKFLEWFEHLIPDPSSLEGS